MNNALHIDRCPLPHLGVDLDDAVEGGMLLNDFFGHALPCL